MQSEEMKRVAVIGAGLMGHGIAQEFAVAGFDVVLQARTDESLSKAIAAIRTNLAHLVQLDAVSSKAAETAPGQIELTTDLEVAAANADIVIESVYEDLELKQRIFASSALPMTKWLRRMVITTPASSPLRFCNVPWTTLSLTFMIVLCLRVAS